jgi:hypothetical protein
MVTASYGARLELGREGADGSPGQGLRAHTHSGLALDHFVLVAELIGIAAFRYADHINLVSFLSFGFPW